MRLRVPPNSHVSKSSWVDVERTQYDALHIPALPLRRRYIRAYFQFFCVLLVPFGGHMRAERRLSGMGGMATRGAMDAVVLRAMRRVSGRGGGYFRRNEYRLRHGQGTGNGSEKRNNPGKSHDLHGCPRRNRTDGFGGACPGQMYALQARKHIAVLRRSWPDITIATRWCPAHKGIPRE